MPRKAIRVGLISPYMGTNLGDQAIQAACMANLRARLPDVEIVGIYLSTWRTADLHGIRTHPLTGLLRHHYSSAVELFGPPPQPRAEPAATREPAKARPKPNAPEAAKAPPNPDAAQPPDAPAGSGLRALLKSVPGLKWCVMQLRSLADALGRIAPEPPALWRAWRLVGELDLVLAAGGGQIDDEWGRAFGQPYTYLRWALLARLRGRPFAVASVGVSKLRHRPSQTLFRWALGMTDYVSCRDGASAAALSALLKGRDVPVVYDLAIGLSDVVDVHSRDDSHEIRVVLSPMSFGKKGIWPTEAEQVYDRYIGIIAEFVAGTTARNIPVTLVTSSGDDANAVRDLIDRLRASSPGSLELVETVKPTRLDELSRCLAGATIVVASRLHGVILSHMLERPVVALSFDPKVDAQMQQFDQADLLTSIRSFTLRDLEAMFDDALERRDRIRTRIRERTAAYRNDVGRQYDTLAALARRHAGISS